MLLALIVLPQSFITVFILCKPDETPLLCSHTTDKETDRDENFFHSYSFSCFHLSHLYNCTDSPDFHTRDVTTSTQCAGRIQQPLLGQTVVAQTVDGDRLKICQPSQHFYYEMGLQYGTNAVRRH